MNSNVNSNVMKGRYKVCRVQQGSPWSTMKIVQLTESGGQGFKYGSERKTRGIYDTGEAKSRREDSKKRRRWPCLGVSGGEKKEAG